MPVFEIRECTNSDCLLRLPIEIGVHRGAFCPRCGSDMACVVPAYQNEYNSGKTVIKNNKISVLLDNIRSGFNVGAILRTADGVGIQKIYLCGITPNPDRDSGICKTALGAEETLPWEYHPNAFLQAQSLKEKGALLLGLECTPYAKPIHEFRLLNLGEQPLVLIVGNERAGIDPGILEICNAVISIPMLGTKRSLNVAVAFSVAAYGLLFMEGSSHS